MKLFMKMLNKINLKFVFKAIDNIKISNVLNLFLYLIVFSFIGCNSQKDEKNIGKSNFNENYKFELVTTFKQPEDLISPTAVCKDSLGNIYISCSKSGYIYKFDSKIKYLSRFGGKGPGPGEFNGGPVTLRYINGKILSSCYQDMTTNVYNLESKFIRKISKKLPSGLSGSTVFNNQLLMHLELKEPKKDEIKVESALAVLDSEFNSVERKIYSHEVTSSNLLMPVSDILLSFVGNKSNLYIGEVSSKEFCINIYDKKFNKVDKITRNYRSIINEDENQALYLFSNYGAGFKRKSNSKWKNKKIAFKAINKLFVDKYNRLWVISPKDKVLKGEIFVDVYHGKNILGSFQLPFNDKKFYNYVYSKFFVLDNYIFYFGDKKIKIYSY